MKLFSLYIKTHKVTGLKYLGQTNGDVMKYRGSGKDWKIHLKKFGNSVTTEILNQTTNWEELIYWGKYYSSLYNVVGAMDDYGNKIYANRIRETGGGGWEIVNKNKLNDRTGAILTDEQKRNVSIGKLASITEEYKKLLSESSSGKKNPNYDFTVYTFENSLSREVFVGTKFEFRKFSGLEASTISNLVSGIRKTYKKWSFKGQTNQISGYGVVGNACACQA